MWGPGDAEPDAGTGGPRAPRGLAARQRCAQAAGIRRLGRTAGGRGGQAGRSCGFKEARRVEDPPARPEAAGVLASGGRPPGCPFPATPDWRLTAPQDGKWTLGSTPTLPPAPGRRDPGDPAVPGETAVGKSHDRSGGSSLVPQTYPDWRCSRPRTGWRWEKPSAPG